jgi:hypothetical protein
MHWRRRTPCPRRLWRTARSAWVALLPWLHGVPLVRSIGTASFLTEALSLGPNMLSICCNVVWQFFRSWPEEYLYMFTTHAPSIWPEFSRRSLRRNFGTMRPGGRSAGPAPPCAKSTTTALTRSPSCSVWPARRKSHGYKVTSPGRPGLRAGAPAPPGPGQGWRPAAVGYRARAGLRKCRAPSLVRRCARPA